MEPTEPTAPTAPRTDPDRHIEDARESLVAHLGELGRRFRTARAQLDVPARIAARPLAAVGVAFALGALLGLGGGKPRKGGEPGVGVEPRSLGRAALAGLVALGVRVGKDIAMRRLSEAAQAWWTQHQALQAQSGYRTPYARGGREPFFDH